LNTAYERLVNAHNQSLEQIQQYQSIIAKQSIQSNHKSENHENGVKQHSPPSVLHQENHLQMENSSEDSTFIFDTPQKSDSTPPLSNSGSNSGSNLISFDDGIVESGDSMPLVPNNVTGNGITEPVSPSFVQHVDLLSMEISTPPVESITPVGFNQVVSTNSVTVSPIKTSPSFQAFELTTSPRGFSSSMPDSPDKEPEKKWKMTVMDENGKQSENLVGGGEDLEREAALKMYYDSKLQTLSHQVQQADDKAIKCYNAYKQAKSRLAQIQNEKNELTNNLMESKQKLESSMEDMTTTKKSYEEQMNVLTEHMSIQNERIAQLDNEMGGILNSKVYCTKCKKWNAVKWLISEGKNGQKCSGGNHGTNFNFAS